MKTKSRTLLAVECLGFCLLCCSGQLAVAQESADSTYLDNLSLSYLLNLEMVIVTAQKRKERLQDVPVAVTVLTKSQLANAGILKVEELVKLAPSLTFQNGYDSRGSSFYIRGIGTQAFSSGVEPSVSTMVDDIVLGRSGMAFFNLMDVEQVEILRGPQGTLFGKNSSAGVVHVKTANPTDEFESKTNITFINNSEYHLQGFLSGPISDELAYRMSFSAVDREGHLTNVNPLLAEKVGGTEDWGFRSKLRWNFNDATELMWSIDYMDRKERCCADTLIDEPLGHITGADWALLDPVKPSVNNRELNVGNLPFNDSTHYGGAFYVERELADHTLNSITSLRRWEIASGGDVDLLPFDILDVNEGSSKQDQFTQEIRLTSPADQPLDYVVGFYYFHQKLTRTFERIFANPPLGGASFDSEVTTSNVALFAQGGIKLGDSVRLILGARALQEEIKFDYTRINGLMAFGPAIPFSTDDVPSSASQTDDTNLSLKLGIQWNPKDTLMLYSTFTQGYKGKAFNVIFGLTEDELNQQPLKPETNDSLEWGIKSQFFDNRLELNTALFYTNYQELQIQAWDENSSNFRLTNAGEIDTKGFEIDVRAKPTSKLTVYISLSYVNARFGNLLSICNAIDPCDADGTQSLDGKTLPHSPNWKTNVFAQYLLTNASRPYDISLKINYRWQDDVQFSLDQDPNTIQVAYDIWDISVSILDHQKTYECKLFINNLLDSNYAQNIAINRFDLNAGYMQILSKGSERTFGLEMTYSW